MKRILLVLTTFIGVLHGGMVPVDDARSFLMCAERPKPMLQHSEHYFYQPIPKTIHQIQFGEASPNNLWNEYARCHDYQYRLWGPADDAELAGFMIPENFQLMLHFRAIGDLISAEQIASYELLRVFGGIYAHSQLVPPSVDVAMLAPMRGAVFTTEQMGRSIHTCAIMVTPALMMSCPGHPLFEHLARSIVPNCISCTKHGLSEAALLTGTYLLNKVLAGSFTVLPPQYLARYGTDVFVCSALQSGPTADYDRRSNALFATSAEIDPQLGQDAFFERPIPKIVHQIWFGDQSRVPGRTEIWKAYCEALGYQYKLWTEVDDPVVCRFMLPGNFLLMLEMRGRREYKAASDILRCELLNHFGGLYADCDMGAPREEGQWIDFDRLVPMEGLVLTSEWHCRNIGTSALFVLNGLMLSCPHHPLLQHYAASMQGNYEAWIRKSRVWDMYITGPFLLNKILAGSFSVISPLDLGDLGVWNP